jgi:hypothetical protein
MYWPLLSLAVRRKAVIIDRALELAEAMCAASRTREIPATKIEESIAIMAIAIKSSISVKAFLCTLSFI